MITHHALPALSRQTCQHRSQHLCFQFTFILFILFAISKLSFLIQHETEPRLNSFTELGLWGQVFLIKLTNERCVSKSNFDCRHQIFVCDIHHTHANIIQKELKNKHPPPQKKHNPPKTTTTTTTTTSIKWDYPLCCMDIVDNGLIW